MVYIICMCMYVVPEASLGTCSAASTFVWCWCVHLVVSSVKCYRRARYIVAMYLCGGRGQELDYRLCSMHHCFFLCALGTIGSRQ